MYSFYEILVIVFSNLFIIQFIYTFGVLTESSTLTSRPRVRESEPLIVMAAAGQLLRDWQPTSTLKINKFQNINDTNSFKMSRSYNFGLLCQFLCIIFVSDKLVIILFLYISFPFEASFCSFSYFKAFVENVQNKVLHAF